MGYRQLPFRQKTTARSGDFSNRLNDLSFVDLSIAE
jgi:hypothetical protein